MPWKLDPMLRPQVQARYLQFGHGCDAVETRTGPARSAGTGPAFNSATAVMPWKRGRPRSPTDRGIPDLQFGHGCDAVETSPVALYFCPSRRPSIRPRL